MLRHPIALLLFVLLAGCGGVSTRQAPPEGAAQAERLFTEGEFDAAARAFLDAADARRATRDLSRLRAAEAWREGGDLAQARAALAELNPRKFDADARLRLDLLQAELALDAGRADVALKRLAMPAGALPAAYRPRYHHLRAAALERSGDGFGTAAELALLESSLTPGERADNTRRIQQLLLKTDDETLFQRSAALPADHPLYLYAGRMLAARGLTLPRPYRREQGFGAQAADRPPAAADGYRPFTRVALLLPLQGPFALAARSVRDGFMSAYFAEPRQKPLVRVYDSGEGGDAALAAYERAVADGAEVVVGPLARDAVSALFERAEIRAPLLALNRGAGAPPPPGSVSFALAPEDEGIAAAERMLRRGWRRAIAVAGSDEGAQRALGAFRERMQQRDAQIVAEIRLPEGTPDYATLIRQALSSAGTRSTPAAEGDAAAAPDAAPASLPVAADAIFLATRSAQARLFVPQLRVAGVYDVPIVATSQVAAGDANARMDRELDGIEFTEVPWLMGELPGVPARAPLAAALESARGGGARLFAFGLDAFRLLGHLDQLGADPNQRLDGATGQLWLDGFGQVQRSPGWARFINGHVQPAPDGGLISDGVRAQ
jgi:outer membrane PBP1 activator LpoA protein